MAAAGVAFARSKRGGKHSTIGAEAAGGLGAIVLGLRGKWALNTMIKIIRA